MLAGKPTGNRGASPHGTESNVDKATARCYNPVSRSFTGKEQGSRLTNQDLQRELDVAIHLARAAGDTIMGYYQTGVAVDHKARREPVTAADRAADDLISAGLRKAFPGDGLLTEESDDDLSRLEKERVWIVDPLDGTTEFINETGEFSVQIALAWHGYPVLGVVYQPVKGLLFHAVQGQGAYEIYEGRTFRLQVSTENQMARMCMVASRSHYSPLVERAREALGIETVDRLGSVGLKVGLLARGKCDLYVATTVVKEWDSCAPHALLVEAGGVLTTLAGEPLVYNKADVVERRGLIGSNGLNHEQIVETLAVLLDDRDG
jgi:3'(2'), 5'-bisphosphate nucleotidase